MKNPNTSMLRTLIVLAVVFVAIAKKLKMNQETGTDGMHMERMTFNGQENDDLDFDLPNNLPEGFLNNPTIRLMIRYQHNRAQQTTRGDAKMTNCMQKNGMNSLRLFMMGITPKCDENGNLQSKQCYDHSEQCVCVRKDGSMINKPSTNIKGCQCLATKDEEENSDLIGGYIPQCEADGTFMKKQCHYSTGYCHCADPVTGKNTTVPARMDVDINCDAPSESETH
ncbi:uncharacterized protein LOC129988459 [Argiope bruennichi]|uniref:uncharacterized protein LOC129988459 n=1 Tax=Argiope bruennichi TaxID=94029 RepID=UPI002493EDB3|nr:uncharacterized protein LOC129988459 [Argiope bruennichi]XP_055952666.1 uncharacterized protein LOC129988459 [Argiope bruennichi]XP_055952667.1 uncharacterized protein LOC129988459 [Argiope bruennichi]